MPKTADVIIVGGGVIGCSIAYQLAKRGIKSMVLERAQLAAGASGATVGAVAPLWHLDPPHCSVFDLGIRSLEMFPELAGELLEAGVDPAFRQNGVLKLAFSPEEAAELKRGLGWQGELGLELEWLEPSNVFEREPEVSRAVIGGVFSPREGHVEGQRYTQALAHAATRLGALIVEGTEVTGLQVEGTKITGVRTGTGTYASGHTVVAAGPWTGWNRWLPEDLPVRGIKGQRILLRMPGFLPRCPVRNSEAYVVPWSDGNLLVGATREEGRFDEETTAEGIRRMAAAAMVSFPSLGDASFVGARAGVRPGTPDDVPIMGPVSGWEGLSIATGHDAVGVMLSPGSGELMANYISTGDPEPLEPFSASRFQVGK